MKAAPHAVAVQVTQTLLALRNDAQAAHLMRFFKTGPGQYGEGDRFLGIKVPVVRSCIKPYRGEASLADCDVLLDSEWHEIRLAGLFLMVSLAAFLHGVPQETPPHTLRYAIELMTPEERQKWMAK